MLPIHRICQLLIAHRSVPSEDEISMPSESDLSCAPAAGAEEPQGLNNSQIKTYLMHSNTISMNKATCPDHGHDP